VKRTEGPLVFSPGDAEITIQGQSMSGADFSRACVINRYGDGSFSVISGIDFEEADYQRVIEMADAEMRSKGSFIYQGRAWKFRRVESSDNNIFVADYETAYVFLDITSSTARLHNLLLNLVVIGIVSIVVVLLLSMRLANRAIAPVDAAIERQRRFVADASHELKTPLAIIGTNAEAARGADDVGVWLDNIEEETGRMGRLIENLLALAKTEEKRLEISAFDLMDAIEEETMRVEPLCFDKGIAFRIENAGMRMGVRSDRGKLQQAISCLLENAVKYTPRGGEIVVRAWRADRAEKAYVSVSNTGNLIEAKDLPHLFDRFYRVDKSHNSTTGGHGIGLSIAYTIAESLDGGIRAESVRVPSDTPGGGAMNTFTLNFSAI